jgi:O-antigen ligase
LLLYLAKVGAVSSRLSRVLIAAVLLTAAFTISPGLGGLALALGMWIHLRDRDTTLAWRGRLALGAGVAAALAFLVTSTVALTGSGFEPSVRVLTWKSALGRFLERPLIGHGVGTDAATVAWMNPSGIAERLTEAHNMWLSVAAQEGVAGLVAFGALVGFLLVSWRRSRANMAGPPLLADALGVAFCGAVLFQGLTASLEDTRHVWVLMGALAAVSEHS